MADKKREPNAFERLIQQPKPKGPPAPPRPKPATPRNAAGQPATKAEQESLRVLGTQGRAAQANQSAANRARAGDPRTLTQRAQANPNTYEARVAQARKQLGIKPGTPDDELLKSALYLRIDNTGWENRDEDGRLRIVPADAVREVTRRMRNPKEREQLRADVEARRAMRDAQTPSQIRPATPEEAANMARRGQIAASEDALRASGAEQTRQNIDRIAGEFTRPVMDALGTPIGRFAAGAFGALPREAQEGAVNLANEALNPLVFAPRTLQYGQELLSSGPVLPETRAGAAVGLAGAGLAVAGYMKGLGAMFQRIAAAGGDIQQVARTTEGAQAMVADMVRAGAPPIEAVQAVERVRNATPEELQNMVDELAQATPPPAAVETPPAGIAARQAEQANQAQNVPQVSAKNLPEQAAAPTPLAEAAPAAQAPQTPDLTPSRAIPEQAAGQPNAIQEPQATSSVLRQGGTGQKAGQEAQVGLPEVRQGQAQEVGRFAGATLYRSANTTGKPRGAGLGEGVYYTGYRKLAESYDVGAGVDQAIIAPNAKILASDSDEYDRLFRASYDMQNMQPRPSVLAEMARQEGYDGIAEVAGNEIAQIVVFNDNAIRPAPVAPVPPKPATPKPPKPPAPKPPKAVVPPPEEPNLIGFRHQDIEPRLKEAGIDPIVIERLGDAGMRKAAAEEGYVARASDTARRIVESKKGSVDAKEVLGMQMRRLDIAVRQRALDKAIREAGDDITKLGQIDQELAALGREIVDIDQAIRLSTSEAGRTLREARFAIDADTLDEVGIRNRWRGAAQGDLPANIEAQVKERAAAIAKAEEELADAQAALSKLEKENADLRAKVKMAEADSALKAKATPSRPRALQELETKATADFQSWKQKFAKAGVKGGKQRGSAIDPALLYEGAYLYSKMMLIKGVRKLDDIIRGAKEEGIELSREEMARAVERAADDLKPARKPKLEATMASLRKEIMQAKGKGAMLDDAAKARNAKLNGALKQVKELNAKLTRAATQEELDSIRDQLNKLSREIGPGKNFAEDGGALTVRRVNPETGKVETMEVPQLAEQRAKVREARAKLDRERGKVKQVQELLRRKAEFNEKKGFEAAKAITMEALGTLKALNLSADLGMFLRQGGIPLVTRPGGLGRSFKSLRKSFTEAGYDDVMAVIASNRFYDDAIDAGLKVGLDKEEDFLFNIFDIIDKKGDNKIVSGLNKYVKFNDRTYTAAIHQIRMDLFDELASGLEKSGTAMTKAEAKALAEFINDMTGASSLGSLDRHVPLLNNLLISARYYASRIKMLTSNVGAVLGTRPGLPPRVRLIMAKEYGRFLSFIGAIGLASHIYSHVAQKPQLQERDRLLRALRQAKGARKREIQDRLAVVNDGIVAMQFDPRGSGAFTVKIGPARIDLTAGLRPFVNFFTRTGISLTQSRYGITGENRMPNFVTSAGREVSDADYGSFSTMDQLIMSFFLMRSNPLPRILMADYARGPLFDKPTFGQPMMEDALRGPVPLALSIPVDTGLAKQGTFEERAGAAGLALLINFLGLGSYEIPEKEKQAVRDQKKLEKEREKKREELRNPGN